MSPHHRKILSLHGAGLSLININSGTVIMEAIDLFAGMGGFSTGAQQAGVNVVWAANHWQAAVDMHQINHPNTRHKCQDLHQANWELIPKHDLMLASPCCQGHSKARGKGKGNPQHDASRSTAWAVVSAAEHHNQEFIVVENVPEFLQWKLYPAWSQAMKDLGYSIAPHIIDAADLGAPQNRVRLFIVLAKSKAPINLKLHSHKHKSASTFVDLQTGNWSEINKKGRAVATLQRIESGREKFGKTFLISYYGNTKTGRDIGRPIGTITTRDRWAIIHGNKMRMLTKQESAKAMGFPESTTLPNSHKLAIHMLGNAVCPPAAKQILLALKQTC